MIERASTDPDAILDFTDHLVALYAAPDQPHLVGTLEFLGERALDSRATVLAIPGEDGLLRPAPSVAVRTAFAVQTRTQLGLDALSRNPEATVALVECARSMRASVVGLAEVFDVDEVGGVNTVLITPASFEGEMVGVLMFVAEDTAPALAIAAILAKHAAVAILQLRQRENMGRLHSTDARLWVPDEQFLRLQLEREVSRARRYGRELGIALIELENEPTYRFKYGSFLADQILRRMGRLLTDSIRDSDILGAFNGGFAVIHVETGLQGTEISAERLGESAAAMVRQRFPEVPAPILTVTTAALSATVNTADALLATLTHAAQQDVAA